MASALVELGPPQFVQHATVRCGHPVLELAYDKPRTMQQTFRLTDDVNQLLRRVGLNSGTLSGPGVKDESKAAVQETQCPSQVGR